MEIGGMMIIAATLSSLGACATGLLTSRYGSRTLSVMLSLVTFGLLTAVLIFLGFLFTTSDMSYSYVWSNSSKELAGMYKLSGIWSGAPGSFLLWIWFMSLVLAVEVMLEPRRRYLSGKFHAIFQTTMAGIIFLFMVLLLDMNLFARTSSFLVTHIPDGNGMQLILQTPEMVLHPPVVFAGYAFCIAAFAAGVAYLLTNEANWTSVSLMWGRLSWLFLTLGIGIGAIWAYYVLGWGGYWAWDPVETSSLLPWLVSTAFLHTQVRHARKGEYGIMSPALGMLSFVAVVFATFATRAGSIWTSSVHAFGSSVGATAGDRFSYLLQHDSTVLGIFLLMIFLLMVAVFLSYDRYRLRPKAETEDEPERFSEYISDKNNMILTVALLLITSAVMLLILFRNVNVTQTANMDEFNQKMSLFFVALMVTMSICLAWKALGKEIAFWIAAATLVVSAVLGALATAGGWANGLVAFSLPSYVLAVLVSGYKIARSRVSGSLRKTLQKASPQIVHLGVALVLVSFVVSTNMQVFPTNLQNLQGLSGKQVSTGGSLGVGDFTVHLVGLTTESVSSGYGGTAVDQAKKAVIDLAQSGKTVRSGIVLTNLFGHDVYGNEQVMQVEVYIFKTIAGDLYLDYTWLNSTVAFIQAKVVPMMNFLWAGFGLLAVGLAIRTVVWRQEPKEAKAEQEEERPAPETAKEAPAPPVKPPPKAEDYDAMVEEELRKFKEKRGK